jgi:hypothetical protein
MKGMNYQTYSKTTPVDIINAKNTYEAKPTRLDVANGQNMTNEHGPRVSKFLSENPKPVEPKEPRVGYGYHDRVYQEYLHELVRWRVDFEQWKQDRIRAEKLDVIDELRAMMETHAELQDEHIDLLKKYNKLQEVYTAALDRIVQMENEYGIRT